MQVGDFCYRLNGVAVLQLPWRVRLADGLTRTDPSQYILIEGLLESLGYTESTITQEDIDAFAPPPAVLKSSVPELAAAFSALLDAVNPIESAVEQASSSGEPV